MLSHVYRYRIWFNGQLMKLYVYYMRSYVWVFDIVPVVIMCRSDLFITDNRISVFSSGCVRAKIIRKKYGFGKAFSIGTIKGIY